jgi:hypothetical protein
VFGHANGFIVNDTILIEYPLLSVETSRHQRCFRVVDPAKIGQRIELITSKPVLIFVHATRASNEEPFREDSAAERLSRKVAAGEPCTGASRRHRRALQVS